MQNDMIQSHFSVILEYIMVVKQWSGGAYSIFPTSTYGVSVRCNSFGAQQSPRTVPLKKKTKERDSF